MDKLILPESAMLPLQRWIQENAKWMTYTRDISNKTQMQLLSKKASVTAKVIRKGEILDFELKVDSRFVARVEVERTPGSEPWYQYEVKSRSQMQSKSAEKGLNLFVRTMIATYLFANCFVLYGTLDKDENLYLESKNQGNDKVIQIRSARTHQEKGPNGSADQCKEKKEAYRVIGHFRKCKSGKVVWAKEHKRKRLRQPEKEK